MKIVYDIPEDIAELLIDNPDIGRTILQDKHNLTEREARFYSKLWKERITDASPKVVGMQHILQDRTNVMSMEIKRIKKQLATEDELLKKIGESIPVLKVKHSIPILTKKKKVVEEREVTTIWSDWHAGEYVNLGQMEGFNSYNFEILYGRLWDLTKGVIRIIQNQKNSFDINILNIDLLGDMVSGNIHQELRETNDYPMLQTVMMLAHVTAQAITALTEHFKLIRVMGLPGNHGRQSKKPIFKNRVLDNHDTLFYHITSMYLKDYIAEGRVEFNIPASSECITVRQDWAFLLGHSDNIIAWAGFPVYGFFRDNAKQQKMRKLRSVLSKNTFEQAADLNGAIINMSEARAVSGYDYREAAHWHQNMVLDDWTTVINGSLIGGNEYSKDKLHAISKPSQTLMFISEQFGLKAIEPIFVRDKGHGFHIFEEEGVLGDMAKHIFTVIDGGK